jgi:hypothetical protein
MFVFLDRRRRATVVLVPERKRKVKIVCQLDDERIVSRRANAAIVGKTRKHERHHLNLPDLKPIRIVRDANQALSRCTNSTL